MVKRKKNKKTQYNFFVRDPIFNLPIFVCVGYNNDELKHLLYRKFNFIDSIDTAGFGGLSFQVTDTHLGKRQIIWLETLDDMTILIHEICHTADKVFSNNNISLTMDVSEFRALFVGGLYGRIADKIKKYICD